MNIVINKNEGDYSNSFSSIFIFSPISQEFTDLPPVCAAGESEILLTYCTVYDMRAMGSHVTIE